MMPHRTQLLSKYRHNRRMIQRIMCFRVGGGDKLRVKCRARDERHSGFKLKGHLTVMHTAGAPFVIIYSKANDHLRQFPTKPLLRSLLN